MIEAFESGGFMMWPMLAVALGVAWLALRTALRLRREREAPEEARRGLQSILFWGAMAVVLGMLGTVVGWVVMTRAIGLAGEVETSLVWGGFGVSLVTLVFGLLIFLFSAVAWFVLQGRYGRVAERTRALPGA
jgi:biopolymer transport protein ExbB/TolQ